MSPFWQKAFTLRRPSIGSIGAKIHPAKNLLLFFCSTQQKHYAARRFFSVVPFLKFSPCGKRWRQKFRNVQNRQPPKNQHIQSSIGFCEQARQGPPFFLQTPKLFENLDSLEMNKTYLYICIYIYIWNKRHLPQAQLWLVCLENHKPRKFMTPDITSLTLSLLSPSHM